MTTDATQDSARLIEAADYLDHLHAGSKHIPTDLIHDRDFRVGLVCTQTQSPTQTVAQFFWGGAAEVFLALGPASLPLLSQLLRDECKWNRAFDGASSRAAALALADHILAGRSDE
jgi:hypothetical protein